jgi:hypothetical protein
MARLGRSAWRNNFRYVVASVFACFLLLLRCLFWSFSWCLHTSGALASPPFVAMPEAILFSRSFGSLATFASPPLVATPEAMSFSWCRRPSRTLAFLTFLPSPMAPFSDSALCCHGYLHFFITPLLLYVQLPFSLRDIC